MPDGWTEHALDFPRLVAAQPNSAYEVHLGAVEYSLASPITIRDRDDIQSAKHWSEMLDPFEHQVKNLITFCRRAPVALIADEVGLGKTISGGLILSELMTRKKVKRALVLCPKILLAQWKDELKTKFGIRSKYETGRDIRWLVEGREQVILTTYDTARNYMETIRDGGFDMIILDEAHKLRNLYGSQQPPRLATELRRAFAEKAFKYVLMLTATPIQNRLWDLYSLIDCLSIAKSHDNPFGRPDEFARRYIADGRSSARELRPSMREEFRRHLAAYMVRTNRRMSGLVFPERQVLTRACEPAAVEAEMLTLVRETLPKMNALSRVSLAQAMMSSPSALAAQLENMARNGTAPPEAARRARAIASRSPTGAKLGTLRQLANELRNNRGPNWRMVVFTRRKETQDAIGAALEADGALVGYIRGGRAADNGSTIAAFWRKEPEVNVIVSTDAGAEGINLQIANVVVNYDLPWNPMIVEQRIGRIQRLASEHHYVMVVNLVVGGSIEEQVVLRLLHRLQVISQTIGDVEAILEATSKRENADEDFEKDLKDLAIKALMGQDVDAATAAIEETIERARQMYEQERETVEENLGHMDAMHTAGPTLPDLEPVVPRLDLPTFVRQAYEAEGAVVSDAGDGRLRIDRPGHGPLLVTFDEDDPMLTDSRRNRFGSSWIKLMAEGQRDFERLVGAWASKRLHRVRDVRAVAELCPEAVSSAWLAERMPGTELRSAQICDREPRFKGRATFKASVNVAHDRFERLVAVEVGDPSAEPPIGNAQLSVAAEELYLPELPPHEPEEIRGGISKQPDFERFATFYEARRDEELKRAKSEELRTHVELSFTPQFAGILEAADGYLAEEADVEVVFALPDGAEYPTRLKMLAGRVTEEPPLANCVVSGRIVPEDIVVPCSISASLALPHLLVRSEASERLALPEYERTCQLTGKTLLSDEVRESAISGTVAEASEFETCVLTGDLALRSELDRCEVTDAWVRPDRVAVSEVSGKRVRDDQLVESGFSRLKGHESEMERCQETRLWLAPSEVGTSDVSGKKVHLDRLVTSSKPPGRRGLASEVVTCAISGAQLLSDEVVESAVSGIRADPDRMARSDVSNELALPSEVVRCEETGVTLLPSESGVCAVTGKRVRSDHLEKSDFSGRSMLTSLLETCPETNKRGASDELVRCKETGYLVDPAVTVVCSATNQRVLERLTIVCPDCDEPLLRREAVADDSGNLGHAEHIESCAWTGERHFRHLLEPCRFTGVRVKHGLVGKRGMIDAHEQLLQIVKDKYPPDDEMLPLVREAFADEKLNPSRVWVMPSEGGGTLAVIAEERVLMGVVRRLAIAFVDRYQKSKLGRVAKGLRPGEWL